MPQSGPEASEEDRASEKIELTGRPELAQRGVR